MERASELLREFIYEDGPVDGSSNRSILSQIMDLDLLKQRDRDSLDKIFQSWRADRNEFDIVTLRDQRLRAQYAERYDW